MPMKRTDTAWLEAFAESCRCEAELCLEMANLTDDAVSKDWSLAAAVEAPCRGSAAIDSNSNQRGFGPAQQASNSCCGRPAEHAMAEHAMAVKKCHRAPVDPATSIEAPA
jgi:hypothetical protein